MKAKFFLLGILPFFIVISPGLLGAQVDYPTNPIQIVVGYGAGGSADMLARALAQEAKKYLGQEIVVLNKPGAMGIVAVNHVATAKPDGYTLGGNQSSTFISLPWLQDLTIDPLKEITPIISFAKFYMLAMVKSDSPFKTLKDFLEYAKKNPDKATFGTPGFGTAPQIVMAAIAAQEGVKINFVNFPGDAQIVSALLGGHIQAAGGASAGYVSHIKAGALRILAALEEERVYLFPESPSVAELGYPYSVPVVVLLYGRKGIPEPIIRKFEDAFNKTSQSPAFKEFAAKNAAYMEKIMLREELTKFLDTEKTKSGEIIRRLGLRKK